METSRMHRYEYHPIGHHLNDFTLIEGEEELWHLFHITGRAPKGSPALSNEHLAEGHAVTRDFIHWHELPPVAEFSAACFVIKASARYAMIKGISHISWSEDLHHWSPLEAFVYTNDPAQWYETRTVPEEARYVSRRDPFIHYDAETGKYLMLYCDRVGKGELYGRGCVGALESTDLVHWTFLPPVFHSGRHFYCESPHLVISGGKYHLFFSLSPEGGLRHAVSETLRGPYEEVGEGNVLPAYFGASEAIERDGAWLFFARLLEREEGRLDGRLMPGSLSLPLALTFDQHDRCIFAPYQQLASLHGALLIDGFLEGWRPASGTWVLNGEETAAQNHFTRVPAGAVLGSAYLGEARLHSTTAVRNFDLTCTLQMPTFSTASMHFRGGVLLRGSLRLEIDALLQTAILAEEHGTVICTAPLHDFQLDRYYTLRIIFLEQFLQVYLDGRLLMYLSAYSAPVGHTALLVWQGEAVFSAFTLYAMPENASIPVFPGGEPLRAECM
jgi:hypothetical protein